MKQNAYFYFFKEMEKVYIETGTKIESFEEYLRHRYSDECYYYSAYAIMGLTPNDYLLRGFLDLDGYKNYHHGWVEFKFEEEDYVFDSRLEESIMLKNDYYKAYKPIIKYKRSQKEILDKYLNEKYAFKIQDGFWQFKYIVNPSDKLPITRDDLNKILDYDRKNGYVPSALMLSRIITSPYRSEIERFIAYSEPSGWKKAG